MKNVLAMFVMVILVSSLSAAQYYGGSINSQAQPLYMPDHPMHAGHGDMRSETTLLGNGGISMGQGDRPASDFPVAKAASLGQIAREFREEHAKITKKAKVTYTNY